MMEAELPFEILRSDQYDSGCCFIMLHITLFIV